MEPELRLYIQFAQPHHALPGHLRLALLGIHCIAEVLLARAPGRMVYRTELPHAANGLMAGGHDQERGDRVVRPAVSSLLDFEFGEGWHAEVIH